MSKGITMMDVCHITAKNPGKPEGLPPHAPLSAAVLRDASRQLGDIRQSLAEILDYAAKGAKDLFAGECWSDNIDMFESLSMEQARVLAKIPVGTNHAKLGPIVFQARAAFIAFRESVRWEIVGKVRPGMPQTDYDEVLGRVTEYVKQASDGMQRVENALERTAS